MMEMTWEDPPERHRESKWKGIAAQLDERPGQWALLNMYEGENAKRNAYSLAGRVRRILIDEFGKGFYELTSRSVPNTDKAGVWGQRVLPSDDQLLEALADSEITTDELTGEMS